MYKVINSVSHRKGRMCWKTASEIFIIPMHGAGDVEDNNHQGRYT